MCLVAVIMFLDRLASRSSMMSLALIFWPLYWPPFCKMWEELLTDILQKMIMQVDLKYVLVEPDPQNNLLQHG